MDPPVQSAEPTDAATEANQVRFETELEVRPPSPTLRATGRRLTPRTHQSSCSASRTRSTSNVHPTLPCLDPSPAHQQSLSPALAQQGVLADDAFLKCVFPISP